MQKYNVHEAKTHLSKLIQATIDGEEVIITKRNKPVIKLVLLPEAKQERRIGGGKNLIISMPDDFDEPLDDFKDYM